MLHSIGCDTCRELSPKFYKLNPEGKGANPFGGKSEVYHLPQSDQDWTDYLKAELSCPVFAIHSGKKPKGALAKAKHDLPTPFLDTKDIFFMGWTDSNTAGCWSYLITRPSGNVMVDVPRYNGALANRLQELGGIKYILMTHRYGLGLL